MIACQGRECQHKNAVSPQAAAGKIALTGTVRLSTFARP